MANNKIARIHPAELPSFVTDPESVLASPAITFQAAGRVRELALIAAEHYKTRGLPVPIHVQAALEATEGAPVNMSRVHRIDVRRPRRRLALLIAVAAGLLLITFAGLFSTTRHGHDKSQPTVAQQAENQPDLSTFALEPSADDPIAAPYNEGVILMHPGTYEKAVQDFTKVLEMRPGFVLAFYNRGVSYMNLQKPELAIQDFTNLIQQKDWPKARYNRGVCFMQLNKLKEAYTDFSFVIEHDATPRHELTANAYRNRAKIRTLLGDYKGAEADNGSATKLIRNRP